MPIIRDSNESMYRIQVGDLEEGTLAILRFGGIEGMSSLFHFDLELVSTDSTLDFASVVGKPVAITVAGLDGERFVNGVASRFEQGTIGLTFTKYYMQVVPAVWTLEHRVDSRIFQDMTTPEIIEEVLTDAGIPSDRWRLALKASYPSREYCVQYQESDWDFVSRLMEEEGIFYFFEHSADCHVMVMGDDSSAHVEISEAPEVIFRDPTGIIPENEYIGAFRWAQSVRTGAYSMRDYNFTIPKSKLAGSTKADAFSEFEAFEFPGRYDAEAEARRLANVRLEERQVLRNVGIAQSVVRRLTPGYRFTMQDHLREDWNREYLVTDIQHEGFEPQALEQEMPDQGDEPEYTNAFRCIPSDVVYRPARETRRPFIRGTQTAVVVGPSGEEIYTDEYGRVKVQFYWDRQGKLDENSSCWMRVAQSWAGAGWGSTFLPRIGQEVLITFLEGDPDRPYVAGSVYNADQMPPYSLPDEKTKTTIKSASSKGADGFNEIRFEDKDGEEQIFIHAERNKDVRVKENRYEFVGHNAHRIVKLDEVNSIESNRHTKVGGDDVEEIGKDRHFKVVGKQAIKVDQSHSMTVGGDVIEVFQGSQSTQVTRDVYVKGMNVVIEAQASLTIKAGASSVVVDATGVTIKGPLVTVDGQMVKIASGPGSPAGTGMAGSAVSPIGPDEAFEADDADPGEMKKAKAEQAETASGKYGKVQVTPFTPQDAAAAEDEDEDEEKTWIEIELVDEEGNPVPGERYEVTLPGGERVASGTLDENGYARVNGIDPGECQVSFPELDQEAWEPE